MYDEIQTTVTNEGRALEVEQPNPKKEWKIRNCLEIAMKEQGWNSWLVRGLGARGPEFDSRMALQKWVNAVVTGLRRKHKRKATVATNQYVQELKTAATFC